MDSFLWNESDLMNSASWKFDFEENTLVEFQNFFKINKIDHVDKYKNEQLCCPSLQELSYRVKNELMYGSGVALISGLKLEFFDNIQVSLIMLAFGLKLGMIIESYGKVYEVIDTGKSYKEENVPVSQTNSETSYHNDSTLLNTLPNFVGLLCVQPAQTGGESLLSSAVNAHKYIEQYNPSILEFLYKDLVRDIITPGSANSMDDLKNNKFPIFNIDPISKSFTCRYMRYWIETGNLKVGSPLQKKDLEALDYLDQVLSAPKNRVKFSLKAGDMLWINNRTICHNRTEYKSFLNNPRKLLRMWIS